MVIAAAGAVLLSASVHAQSSSAERLISVGRLWIAIKYFHPWLAYRDIDWEAAWVQAYPKLNAADNSATFAKAVEDLLASLGDPTTRVVRQGASAHGEGGPIQTRWEAGAILTITVPNSSDWQGMIGSLRQARDDARKASAVVFDLREASETLPFAIGVSGMDRAVLGQIVSAPGERRRFHSGLASESGTSGGYYSGFQVSAGERFEPAGDAKEIPCVFVVDERTYIPPFALALQAAGKATIVSEGAVTDEKVVTTTTLRLTDDLQAKIRLGELLYPDGGTGFVPDIVAAERGGMTAALVAAAERSRTKQVERKRAPSLPSGQRDPLYPDAAYPSAAYRTLAALQIWAAHNYFYPHKKLMDRDWGGVLKEFLPRLEAARDEREYHLGVAEMLTHVHDTHSGARSKTLEQFYGEAPSWLRLRWIENAPVIVQILDQESAERADIALGDRVVQIGGAEVGARVKELSRYLSASTPQALMWKVCNNLLNGPSGSDVSVQLRKPGGRLVTATVARKTEYRMRPAEGFPGDVLRVLPDEIGYADLNRLSVPMVDGMFEKFRNTRAIIFDMRGYPQGTAWSIAPRLTEARSPIGALFSRPIAMAPEPGPGGPAETSNYSFTQPLPPTDKWRYTGRTLMLIDERTISQAEHTGLFFEAANNTKFVGTPTSGANGDVTQFSLPGGIRVGMTGHDVRHADGRQLQRVGLQPDILVAPTVAGIAGGRDEVLERAVEFVKTGR
jgi:C-terminal processing protease CtpA/Prc